MSAGAYLDKDHPPRTQVIMDRLGQAHLQWSELIKWVEESWLTRGEWKFYGKNYGWALRFKKDGKALVSFYPNEGFLTAQVVLSSSAVKETPSLRLRKSTQQLIDRANPYPEGRWVFLKVNCNSDVADVRKLLNLKSGRTNTGKAVSS